ncbi:MAG: winged helix-turn-helix domain-containing protein [Candidatus Helarchaeota archaeon]
MAKNSEVNDSSLMDDDIIQTKKLISNPEIVPILFHEKKQEILKLLIEKEMTIIDLKNSLKMNPGTIKRHLQDLITKNLVKQTKIKINKYGIKMKYYRATARQFIFNIKWP